MGAPYTAHGFSGTTKLQMKSEAGPRTIYEPILLDPGDQPRIHRFMYA